MYRLFALRLAQLPEGNQISPCLTVNKRYSAALNKCALVFTPLNDFVVINQSKKIKMFK